MNATGPLSDEDPTADGSAPSLAARRCPRDDVAAEKRQTLRRATNVCSVASLPRKLAARSVRDMRCLLSVSDGGRTRMAALRTAIHATSSNQSRAVLAVGLL